MTEVTFHFNVADRVSYVCRLLRKSTRKGASVVVTAPLTLLNELNVALWTFDPLEFIAHRLLPAHASMPTGALQTPVWLLEDVTAAAHHDVLLNVGMPAPAGFERFARLIEIVSTDDDDRRAARERLRYYKSQRHALVLHDAASSLPLSDR